MLAVQLPVEARKRMVYVVHAPDVPALEMPILHDPSGVYCMLEDVGNVFICGKVPTEVTIKFLLFLICDSSH